MRRLIAVLMTVILFPVAGFGSGRQCAGAVFYVAPDGNDSNLGRSPKRPLATLARARDAVRALITQGPLLKPVTVYLRGGRYRLPAPVVFKPQDSGTADAPIIYAAYPGETPILSGARMLSGWREENSRWIIEIPDVKTGKWYFTSSM